MHPFQPDGHRQRNTPRWASSDASLRCHHIKRMHVLLDPHMFSTAPWCQIKESSFHKIPNHYLASRTVYNHMTVTTVLLHYETVRHDHLR